MLAALELQPLAAREVLTARRDWLGKKLSPLFLFDRAVDSAASV